MPALDRRLAAVLCCAWLAGSVAMMSGATRSDGSRQQHGRARAQLTAADAVDAVRTARPAIRLRRDKRAVVSRLLPITLLAVLHPGRAPIPRALTLWRPPGFGVRLRNWTLGASIGSTLATAVLCACGVALRRHVRRHVRRHAGRQARMTVRGSGSANDAAWPSPGSPERAGALALVCHEIRTPLHAITGILELLMRKASLTGEVHHYVETAHRCARSLIALASDMLDMARLDAGLLEIRPKAVHLQREVRQLVEEFQPLAQDRGLAIALHLSTAGAGPHRADPQRLRQILSNLLSNAIKFTERGTIAVTLESLGRTPDGERLRIVVRDHGAGIAPCDLERVFQPFFRCDGTSAAPGSGLGLAISRELTRRMGGELWLANHAGGGTEAVLTLTLQCVPPAIAYSPCAFPARTTARTTARTPYGRAAGRTALALIVDDHPASRLVLAEQLRLLGIDSLCAADGNEALARHAATGRPFDLVLTDCNMPGMTGHQLARALRRRERELGSPRCTVLGFSADARPDSRARAVEAGMDDYLCKPIDLDALARRLEQWLPVHLSPLALHAAPDPAGADSIRRALLAANAEDLPALQHAIDSACLPDAAQLAHRIRGAACMAAQRDVAQLAATLESACEGGDIVAARAALRGLRAMLECRSLRPA